MRNTDARLNNPPPAGTEIRTFRKIVRLFTCLSIRPSFYLSARTPNTRTCLAEHIYTYIPRNRRSIHPQTTPSPTRLSSSCLHLNPPPSKPIFHTKIPKTLDIYFLFPDLRLRLDRQSHTTVSRRGEQGYVLEYHLFLRCCVRVC